MKFDDVLRYVGEFGTYQKRLYVGICLPMAFHAIQTMSTVFTLAVPDHRCAIPGWPNDTYIVQNPSHEELISLYIPSTSEGYSSCEIYAFEYSDQTTLPGRDLNTSRRTTVGCQSWVYDTSVFEDTVITDTNLVCGVSIYRAHTTTAFFIGELLGLTMFGTGADKFGRKRTSYVLLLCALVASHLLLWLPNIYIFIIFRLLIGFANGALFNLTFVYAMEFIGPSKRGSWALFSNNFWGIGVVILSGIAFGIRSWRYLQLAFSLPILICLAYWWMLPESPRWLLVKGRRKRANAVLKTIADGNGAILDTGHIYAVSDEEEEEEEDGQSECSSILLLFKNKNLAIRILVVFWNWFVVSMLFFGVGLNVASLSGDLYLNFTISALMEMCGYTLCIPLMDWLGRRRYHVIAMGIGGFSLLLTIVPEVVGSESTRWITTALSMVGKLVSSAAYATVYVYSSELFPTVIRSTVMAASANVAAIGAAVAPYIVELTTLLDGHFARVAPLVVFGALSLSACLTALVLPETAGTDLPDNIVDVLQERRPRLEIQTERDAMLV